MKPREEKSSAPALILFSACLLFLFVSVPAGAVMNNLLCDQNGCSVDFAYGIADYVVTPAKMAASCAQDQILQINGTAWACANYYTGTVTSVTAGTGLSGGTITTTGTIDVNFAGTGTASTAAHSDHTHAGMGTVTSVTAGTGLSGGEITTTGTIAINFTGTGSADTAARSDHTHAGGSSQSVNPLQVALLRWYAANTVATVSVTSGYGPYGIAFDGANIWVSENNTGPFGTGTPAYVTKINAATGAIIGNYTVGLGGLGFPAGVAFDGRNVWVTLAGEDCVAKLDAATGSQSGCYSVGTTPLAAAFDGSNIWVANNGSSNVTKVNPATGAVVNTYTVGTGPAALAFDGTYIWVANNGGTTVSRITVADGTTTSYTVGSGPEAIAFDGTYIWVAIDGTTNNIKKLDSNGAVVNTYSAGSYPRALVFDGTYIWAANSSGGNVTKFNASTGAVVGTYTVGSVPSGLAFDGASIWVTNLNSDTLSKL